MKKKAAPAPRSKGETVVPNATLALVQKIGVTRASKEIGVSTTTLHKARKGNVVSKVVEIAAERALEHLGDHPGKRSVVTGPIAPAAITSPDGRTALIVMEVPADKVDMVQKFSLHLGAKLIAA